MSREEGKPSVKRQLEYEIRLDNKSFTVSKDEIDGNGGMSKFAEYYPGATIRMRRDDDGREFDVPVSEYEWATGRNMRPFTIERKTVVVSPTANEPQSVASVAPDAMQPNESPSGEDDGYVFTESELFGEKTPKNEQPVMQARTLKSIVDGQRPVTKKEDFDWSTVKTEFEANPSDDRYVKATAEDVRKNIADAEATKVRLAEDAEVDKKYTAKEERTSMDVYENFMNRFALTKEGGALQAELAEKESEVSGKYVEQFKKTDAYKDILKLYDGTPESVDRMNALLDDKFNELYGDKVVSDIAPYRQAYIKEMEDRYGERFKEAVDNAVRSENSVTVSKLWDDVSAMRRGMNEETTYMMSPSASVSFRSVKHSKDEEALIQAQQLLSDSRKVIEEATKHKDSRFFTGVGRGVRDNLSPGDFTFGITDMADEKRLNNILTRFEKGEKITDAEEKLLEASSANMITHAYYDQMLGAGYKAGRVTAESLPFMLEFVANPIAGSGKALAKGLLKFGLKKFGGKSVNVGTKFGARLLGDTAAATGMTVTTGLPGVEAEATRRMNENFDYGVRDGELYVERNSDRIGWGEARGKAFAQRAIENQSEMVFNAFGGMSKVLGGKGSVLQKLSESKGGKFIHDVLNNKTVKEIAEATQFHGMPVEYLEEVYNNAANVLMGEMSVEDFADVDKNVETLLGLAPTSVVFGLLGVGGLVRDKVSNRRELNRIYKSLPDDVRGQYDRVMQSKGYNAESVKEFVKGVVTNPRMTEEEKAAAIRLGYGTVVDMTYEDAEAANEVESVEPTATIMGGEGAAPVVGGSPSSDARSIGASLYAEHDVVKMRRAYLRALYSMKRLRDVAGEDVVTAIDNAGSDGEFESIVSSLPESQRRFASDYITQRLMMDGLDDALDARYADDVALADAVVGGMFEGGKSAVPIARLDDKNAIVILNGMDADGNVLSADGSVMGVSVPLSGGVPDWRSFDVSKARSYRIKGDDIQSLANRNSVVSNLLADKFADEESISSVSPINVGSSFPVLLAGELRDVTVVGRGRGNWIIEVIGEKGVEAVSDYELEQWRHDAEMLPIEEEYKEIDKELSNGESIGEDVRLERDEADEALGVSEDGSRAHERGVEEGRSVGIIDARGDGRARPSDSGGENSLQGVTAEVHGDGLNPSALSRLSVYPEGHAKAGRPDYESSKVEDVRDYLLESLGEETALKTVNSTISGTEGRLKEKEDKADRFLVEMENSALEVDDMLRAQEDLSLMEREIASLRKSVSYWKDVRSALGGDIKPIGKGTFGNIYDQFKGKAKDAIQFLLGKKEGEAIGALHHKDIGDISIVWGNAKAGLQKILNKHPEVINNLQGIIDGMNIVEESDNRIKLESDTHFAVVSKEYNGTPREKWLLTAYEKKETSKPANSSMDVDSNQIGKSDDTATRQNTDVSASKDNAGLSDVQEKVEETLPPLDKKIQRRINAAQTREKNRLNGAKEWSELLKARKDFSSSSAALSVLDDMEAHDGLELAAEWLAYGKITPESFKKELGHGLSEQKQFVGMIAKAENGGVSIERAAELLMDADENNYYGGDDYNARNAIISVLGEVSSRGDLLHYIARNRIAEARRLYEYELEQERSYLNEITLRDYGMSVEEYEEDQALWSDYMDEVVEERLHGWENFRDSEAYFDLFNIFGIIS